MIETGQVIELLELFGIRIRVLENDGSTNEAKSLDDIGSTGTGMTAKAMVFVQLVRCHGKKDYGLHFYLDETGQLDDWNLKATTAMAVSKGMVPITAEPGIRMEPLAHPAVTIYPSGPMMAGSVSTVTRRTMLDGKTRRKATQRWSMHRTEIRFLRRLFVAQPRGLARLPCRVPAPM